MAWRLMASHAASPIALQMGHISYCIADGFSVTSKWNGSAVSAPEGTTRKVGVLVLISAFDRPSSDT